ncbi:MAG: thioredoxin domain-containing protein, partial [Burkholderiales bacterium]
PQGEFTGRNLLYIARSIEEVANMTGKDASTVTDALARARLALFEARRQRPRPHLDDKVLTAWNGLMIAAFARGARVLSSPVNLAAAQKAAAFIKNKMWDGTTRTLLRRYRAGEGAIEGYAEDYAFLIWGLLELFQADPDPAWLDWALTLQRRQDELFWDDAAGGWFSTTGRDSSVLLRLKEDHDGAEPSVSSVSVANLLILSHLMADPVFADRIDRTLRNAAPKLPQFARALPMMLTALSMYHAGMGQIAIVGPSDRDDTHHLLHAVNERYQPFSVLVGVYLEPAQTVLARVLPWVAPLTMRDGKATAYVCQDFVCKEPTTSAEELVVQLADRGPRTTG